jgi:hypothetical protein
MAPMKRPVVNPALFFDSSVTIGLPPMHYFCGKEKPIRFYIVLV